MAKTFKPHPANSQSIAENRHGTSTWDKYCRYSGVSARTRRMSHRRIAKAYSTAERMLDMPRRELLQFRPSASAARAYHEYLAAEFAAADASIYGGP